MSFAGFDRSDYPGKAAMAWLRANTNLRWCGFYLAPAPSHQDMSWMDAADADFDGWGFLPIYVGQEVVGPGAHRTSAAQGVDDGAGACLLMLNGGFDKGAVVYLDLENGMPFTAAQHDYVAAWCDAVVKGGFAPGVYCSFQFAGQVKVLRPNAKIWVFHVPTTDNHRVGGLAFATPPLTASGFPHADVWQRDDQAIITCPVLSGGLVCDLSVATSADPSVA